MLRHDIQHNDIQHNTFSITTFSLKKFSIITYIIFKMEFLMSGAFALSQLLMLIALTLLDYHYLCPVCLGDEEIGRRERRKGKESLVYREGRN